MAMISSITANQMSSERAQDRPATVAGSAASDLANYYSALLRCVQTQQAVRETRSFSVGITSCSASEETSVVAINLAIVAARNGNRRVLLVDANTKSPAIAQKLKLTAPTGLTDILSGAALLGDALLPTAVERLSVLAAGDRGKQLGSDYDVDDVTSLLDELSSEFDLIVFNLPQADELSECFAYAEALSGIFLVVSAGQVDGRVARRVTRRLEHGGARILGAIYHQ